MKSVPKQQHGYIFILVIIFLGILMLSSLKFIENSTQSLRMSSMSRTADESLFLAEAAMNNVFGLFSYDGDLDQDGVADNEYTINIQENNIDIPWPYVFYRSDNQSIEQTHASLLQIVANNEARAQGQTYQGKHAIPLNARVNVASLYSDETRPLVFTRSDNGLVASNTEWTQINNTQKAAVWVEVVKDEQNDQAYKLYVQAVAQSQHSKSYVQRYLGTFSLTLGSLAALSEASLVASQTP